MAVANSDSPACDGYLFNIETQSDGVIPVQSAAQGIKLFPPEGLIGKLEFPVLNYNEKLPNPYLRRISCEGEGSLESAAAVISDGSEVETIELIPNISNDGTHYILIPVAPITEGKWTLVIPENIFKISPEFVNVETMPYSSDILKSLSIPGAWKKSGDKVERRPMFTIHEDDGIEPSIPSSAPSSWMEHGYITTLYPLLESLGLRGNISLEGRRAGFNSSPPYLNDNGKVCRRLQNEKGWEIMNHSMICLGEILNNWAVDSLTSAQADSILIAGPNYGLSSRTVSVYDLKSRKQYSPNATNTAWEESPAMYIKPYVGSLSTKKLIMYNPQYDMDYHWGEWFRLAEKFGFNSKCYVNHNSTASHSFTSDLNKICPNGFADMGGILYNTSPLMSTCTRLVMEGQAFPNYKGELDPDNFFNPTHYELFKKEIDKAIENNGWIVLGMHSYRPCWNNYLPGALVSEGGSYPDEWVNPMDGVNPLTDDMNPPARLGINSWSEWYPCPGTRLDMVWQLLKYACESGMINVTSSEGFELMSNTESTGYFSAGLPIGSDAGAGLYDTQKYYPHYVVGSDGSESYYSPLLNSEQEFDVEMEDVIEFPASMASGTLPVIYINTENKAPIVDKETKIPATFYMDAECDANIESVGSPENGLDLTIKGRGNSSWEKAKKPYKIKFDKKTSLMGLPKNKHYVLLANYGNYSTWLAYELGLEISRNLGLGWTPSMYPVELVLNGQYEGVYFLCESIKIAEGRLDITEQEDEETDPEKIPYGWLVEIDNTVDTPQIVFNENEDNIIRFTMKSPEVLSEAQYDWIENELQRINGILYSPERDEDALQSTFDIDSFVKFFITREILTDYDAYSGSFYIHKDSENNPLWTAGPVWDMTMDRTSKDSFMPFDPSFPTWSTPHWMGQFMMYECFNDQLKEIWKEFYTDVNIETILNHISDYSMDLQPAFDANNIRWNDYQFDNYGNLTFLDVNQAYTRIVSGFKNNTAWINNNLDSFDASINSPTSKYGKGFKRVGDTFECLDENLIPGSLRIVNMSGRTVRQSVTDSISVSGIASGVYVIIADTIGGEITMKCIL